MIPNEYHFIFGLTPSDKPFSLVHYLAVASCEAVNSPSVINFYFKYEPSGFWWERAKPLMNLVPIEPPEEIFGNALRHPAHKADVLRLQILQERGGVYLDLDVICLRPFASLQQFDVVMGEESDVGLCNAVILARAGSIFIQRWFDEYRSFSDQRWDFHSVLLPARLAREMPDEIHILDRRKFFWPSISRKDLLAFFVHPDSTFSEFSYCVHLWATLTWPFIGQLQPAHFYQIDSEFCSLARPYIRPEWIAQPEMPEAENLTGVPHSHNNRESPTLLATRQLLAHLPHELREIAVLHHLMGISPQEISMLLGATPEELEFLLCRSPMLNLRYEQRSGKPSSSGKSLLI